MVGIKFAKNVVPFPPDRGIYIRLTFMENKAVQGHVMLFDGDEIIDLANGNMTTPETLMEGDQICATNKQLVTYTKILGVVLSDKASPVNNGSGKVTDKRATET